MTDADGKPDAEAKAAAATADGAKVNGAETADLVVKLRKPIIAHGDEVSVLTFREPTAGDIEACGSPVMLDFLNGEPKMTFETKAMFAMMSRLAAVPPSTIKQMHAKDSGWAALAIAHRFFLPET